MSELTLDDVEQRATALGWPYSRGTALGMPCVQVETPSGWIEYFADVVGEVLVTTAHRLSDAEPCRHDIAALESPPEPDEATGLLSCPFCGGKAQFYRDLAEHVECEGCGVEMDAGSPDATRAAWNRRTP